MNKLTTLFLLAFTFGVVGVNAQTSTTQTVSTVYPMLENRLSKSNKDIENPKKMEVPKTWLNRANVMLDIYDVNKSHIEGQQMLTIKYFFGTEKEIKSEVKEGSTYETYVYDRVNIIYKDGALNDYIETNRIFATPLNEASKSLEKAVSLDVDKKLSKKLTEAYVKLSTFYSHQGSRLYYNSDQEGAFNSFAESLGINESEYGGNVVDTSLMFNTGLVAAQLGKNKESIVYYKKAISHNYPEPKVYAFLKQGYFAIGDTATGLSVINDGFEKYPDNQDILIELINYYLTNDKSDEALEYIKLAQEKDPTNVSLVFAEATLYDKKGDVDNAVKTYKKCNVKDPTFFNGFYNLGVVYYNYAQTIYKKANEEKSDAYKELIKEADTELEKCISPLLECVKLYKGKDNLTADEKETLNSVYETLKSVYYKLKMTDKYEEMKTILEQ